jgi:hypothetical protein
MHGDAVLIVLLLVFGCVAFLFGVVYLLCQSFAWVGRGLLGIFRPCRRADEAGPRMPGLRSRVCPNERCRKVEYRKARFCSQCGTRLP